MAGRKLTLESSSPEEMTLIGISSTMVDYQLIHYLNKELRSDFAKFPDLPFLISATKQLSVPIYHYYHTLTENNWIVLSNRSSNNEFVLPQHKNLDYFFFIDDLIEEDETANFIQKLRRVKDLSLAVNLDTSKINKIDLLYADLEMHLTEIFKK